MTDPETEVHFFGSIAVTLTDLCVSGAALQHVAQNTESSLRVRASLKPMDSTTTERLCESAVSRDHAMRSGTLEEILYVPVMFIAAANPNAECEREVRAEEALRVELTLELSVVRESGEFFIARRTAVMPSLFDITGDGCGVATARVSEVVFRRSGAWQPTHADTSPPLEEEEEEEEAEEETEGKAEEETEGKAEEETEGSDGVVCDGDGWSGVELRFFVRALDLSRTLRLMLSAESAHNALLRLPTVSSFPVHFTGTARPLPYGSIPLVSLYTHYRRFFELYFGRTLRYSEAVAKELSHNAEPGRWAALHTLDLRHTLLGEAALAPVLAAAAHADALAVLRVDANAAGDLSACWAAALFAAHRHLRKVTARDNEIYECGAEQLLRLVRRNRALVEVEADGNPCSPAVMDRMRRVAAANADAIAADAFNVFASSFAYAIAPNSFPSAITRPALGVWAMLSAIPMANDHAEGNEHMESHATTLIPLCAGAPLLSEVVRTVAHRITAVTHDPLVRAVFLDVRSQSEESNGLAETLYAASFVRLVVVTMRSFARVADWLESAAVLRDVGRRQKEMGVQSGDYRFALRVFIEAIHTVCGKERTDAESSVAFLQCLALGIRTAAVGG